MLGKGGAGARLQAETQPASERRRQREERLSAQRCCSEPAAHTRAHTHTRTRAPSPAAAPGRQRARG